MSRSEDEESNGEVRCSPSGGRSSAETAASNLVDASCSSPASSPRVPSNELSGINDAAALLQTLHRGDLPERAVPLPSGAEMQSSAILQRYLAHEITGELIKSQLAFLTQMAIAQSISVHQNSAVLASADVTLAPAMQQASSMSALCLLGATISSQIPPSRMAGGQFAIEPQPSSLQSARFGTMTPQVNAHNQLAPNVVVPPAIVNNIAVFPNTTPQLQIPVVVPLVADKPQGKIEYMDASLFPDPVVKGKASRAEHFPYKVHRMLSALEQQEGGTAIASFLPHGRAFLIHNPKRFTEQVMPRHFRTSRFASFQRQLNLYGFHRIKDGKDRGAYYHQFFLQGRVGLTARMKRTKIKGTTRSPWTHVSQKDEEIDFYKMPPVLRGVTVMQRGHQAVDGKSKVGHTAISG